MSLATQPQATPRRLWRVPLSSARWLWLGASVALYIGILIWYLFAVRTQQFPGPLNDPFRFFGIIAYVLVLGTASYSLRRRFARGLPGKVQDWLWMHTWLGILTILIAVLHENFTYLTHDYCQNLTCITDAGWGGGALFALIFLVLSGVTGRLLDIWQTHIIANEASTNGIGIARAVEERVLEQEYIIERLCAGKSEAFQEYCMQGMNGVTPALPDIRSYERADFQQASTTLAERTRLLLSLQRQQRARAIIRTWRTIHIVLACLALIVILSHGTYELLANVFHVIHAA